jgi:hypothetical protein
MIYRVQARLIATVSRVCGRGYTGNACKCSGAIGRLITIAMVFTWAWLQVIDSKDGEMLERSIRHAWKALRWKSVETYRITFPAVVSRLVPREVSLRVSP